MTGINIKIDDADLKELLERLHARVHDMTPVMEKVGELVRTSVVRNFEVGGRYSEAGSWKGGTKTWAPLSLATLFAGRKRKFAGKRGAFIKGKNSTEQRFKNRKTLIKKGHLLDSIKYKASADGVEIGTNKEYAAIHQFGGKAGRGHKVNIPARPFLVVQDEDFAEIKRVLTEYLTGGMR